MLSTHKVQRNGPYLRIVIPDVLPPDWGALRQDVTRELEEGGIDRVTIVTPHFSYERNDREALIALFYDVSSEVDTCIEWRDPVPWTEDEDGRLGLAREGRPERVAV